MTPEARARQDIDHLLILAGWDICNISDANIHAAIVVGIREFSLLGGEEGQSARYMQGLPPWRRPLPVSYESTGVETHLTQGLDPEPRTRHVFPFHRTETLAALLAAAPAPTLRPDANRLEGAQPSHSHPQSGLRRRRAGSRRANTRPDTYHRAHLSRQASAGNLPRPHRGTLGSSVFQRRQLRREDCRNRSRRV